MDGVVDKKDWMFKNNEAVHGLKLEIVK